MATLTQRPPKSSVLKDVSLLSLLSVAAVISVCHCAKIKTIDGTYQNCTYNHDSVVRHANELIKDNPCYRSCSCKSGRVECQRHPCSPVTGCYGLIRPNKENCCPRCVGCHVGENQFPHGWSSEDACFLRECQAGVLTTSKMQCQVQCTHALPPPKGKCCPRCPGCRFEGALVGEKQETRSRVDPCLRCSCSGGLLTCFKKACPVLSCPDSKTAMGPDGCCPICTKNHHLVTLSNGKCFLSKFMYQDGQSRIHDNCTKCTCIKNFLTCERNACPPLQCPKEYQVTNPAKCCPHCRAPEYQEKVCFIKGVIRTNGESWYVDRCSLCTCTNGQVLCSVEYCKYRNNACPPGHKKVESPSECCPHCVAEARVCVVFGEPHYRTFDGFHFTYQSHCRYVLARDCEGRSFKVTVNNYPGYTPYFAWKRSLSVKLKTTNNSYKISLGQKMRLKVNDKRRKLPFVDEDENVEILRENHTLYFHSSIGLKITWDGVSYVEVDLAGSWFNKTCGLCGNFNGHPEDDLAKRDGTIATNDVSMADSWLGESRKKCYLKAKSRTTKAGLQHKSRLPRLQCSSPTNATLERCGAFLGVPLSRCHGRVPYESFFKSCVQDMCQCSGGHKCECDSLLAYSRLCQRAGVDVADWRLLTGCGGLQCPIQAVYDSCAPPCQPNCRQKMLRGSCLRSTCRPKCFCPLPTVLHRGVCIHPDRCPQKKRKRYRRIR